jgi:hypothetical protein
MSRIYKVPFNGTITNAGGNVDLLSIQPADDKPCRIAGWLIGQTSERGDIQEENVRLTLRHLAATVTIGSGGGAVTGQPSRPGFDPAAGFTARCNDTTVATSSGNDTVIEELAWNIRSSPWERWIPEEARNQAVQGEALVVRMESTVSDDVDVNLTFLIEEM